MGDAVTLVKDGNFGGEFTDESNKVLEDVCCPEKNMSELLQIIYLCVVKMM